MSKINNDKNRVKEILAHIYFKKKKLYNYIKFKLNFFLYL